MSDEPDKEGVYEDSDAGYEQATIENVADLPAGEPVAAATTAQKVIAFIRTEAKEFKKLLTGKNPPEWLLEVYEFYGEKEKFEVLPADDPDKYSTRVQQLSNASPIWLTATPSESEDENGQPLAMKVQVSPGFLNAITQQKQASREKPGLKSHNTQLTKAGIEVDTRTLVGKILGRPETTLRQCQTWLLELDNPELPATQRVKVGIYLGRAEAMWGPEMEQLDPPVHYRILQYLGKPEKSCLWPLVSSDLYDMEGEAEKAANQEEPSHV